MLAEQKTIIFSKHKLFLSHRSVDKPTVEESALTLKKEGVGIWFDKDSLLPSDSLTKKISEGLDEMTHFVLFWSNSCNDSAWVDRELNSAISQLINLKKPIFIVRLDETPVPSIIADLYRIEAQSLSGNEIGKLLNSTLQRLDNRI